jgi:hypothetical protein
VSQNAEKTFTFTAGGAAVAQRRSEFSFVPGDRAFCVRSLCISPQGKLFVETAAVSSCRSGLETAQVHWNDGSSNANIPGKFVIAFAVECSVAEQFADINNSCSISDNRNEQRRVIIWRDADVRPYNQMSLVQADKSEFGPTTPEFAAAGPVQEMPADVVTFQAGRVDRRSFLSRDQATPSAPFDEGMQKRIEPAFFRSRFSA